MKKRIPQILILIQSLMFLSCEMDPAYSSHPDSYYFNKMQPLEWNDNFIFTATNTPQQIQVWDGEKGKLIHTYSLSTDVTKWGQGTERALDILDMAVIDKSVWIICSGKQRNLIKLDVETGEMKYIELDCKPSELEYLSEANNGNGVIMVSTYSDSRVGMAIRFLDRKGNVIQSNNIKYSGINIFSIKDCIFDNGVYYLFGAKDSYFTEEDNDGFKVISINENDNYSIADISTDKIFSDKFFVNELNRDIKIYFASFMPIQTYNKCKYSIVNVTDKSSDYFVRLLYKVNSLENFDTSYTGIKYDEEDARSIYSLEEYNDNVFITGRILYSDNYNGLETGLYPAAGGEQQKRVRLENANQLYCTMKEDCAWFSKNLYTQDPITLKWNKSNKPQIYKLDYKDQQVYQYNADGTYTVLDWIEE